jgi:hypothetical protein
VHSTNAHAPVQLLADTEPRAAVLVLPGHGVHAASFPMLDLYVPIGHGTAPVGESEGPFGTYPARALQADLLLARGCSVVMKRGQVSHGRA